MKNPHANAVAQLEKVAQLLRKEYQGQEKSFDAIIAHLLYGTTSWKWDRILPFD